MLSFVTPWMFGAAVAAAVGVVGLHLLSVRTPPVLVLPTARFVAEGEARAVARQRKLNDVRLLLLRVFALLAAGAAFAGVRWEASRASLLRLVVVDAAVQPDSLWRDSVITALSHDDVLVDVHHARGVASDPGAALVAAIGRAAALVNEHQALSEVELTVVLPPTAVTTLGFSAWRAQWPGRVRVLATSERDLPFDSSALASGAAGVVRVSGADGDDVVSAAFASRARARDAAAPAVRIVRANTIDSAAARDVVVHWPMGGVPRGWVIPRSVDTIGALVANGHVVVGPFPRTAVPDASLAARIDSGQAGSTKTRVIAWWGDGSPAAVEEMVRGEQRGESACTRTVAVTFPLGSDLLLSESARGLLDVLTMPCGAGRVSVTPLVSEKNSASDVGSASAPAPAAAFRASRAAVTSSNPWWLAPLLLGVATALLLVEWGVRNREPQP